MIYYVILSFSLLLNVVLFWYVYNILKKHTIIFDVTEDFLTGLENFSKHLESLYEMETYYGDETLKELLRHSVRVVEETKEYVEIYNVSEVDEEETEE